MIAKNSISVEFGSLTPKLIIELNTPLGYMQVLEYTLQDCSFVHVVLWHYFEELDEDRLPKRNCKTFYRDRNIAIELAETIGSELLKCY